MTEASNTYKTGDQIQIGDETITITERKGANGIRYSWYAGNDFGGESYKRTPAEAVADAAQTIGAPTCRHGMPTTQFCPTCHDTES